MVSAPMQTEERPVQAPLGRERDPRCPPTDTLASLPPHPPAGRPRGRDGRGQVGGLPESPSPCDVQGQPGEPPGVGEVPLPTRAGKETPGELPAEHPEFRADHLSPPLAASPPTAAPPTTYADVSFIASCASLTGECLPRRSPVLAPSPPLVRFPLVACRSLARTLSHSPRLRQPTE